MVGIPGRSKGCIPCRKRKKGCDLQRPGCGQCQDRGLICEGYDADRVFIYQTGVRQRKDSATTSPKGARDAQPKAVVQFEEREAIDFSSKKRSPHYSLCSLPQSFALSAFSEISMEAYVNMYIPQNVHNPYAILAEDNDFVNVLPTLSIRDSALHMAVLAVGTAALGKASDDAVVLQQGKFLYGRALVEMGQALRDPQRAKSEALLAVPKVMGLFEILFGPEANSGTQARSWLSHAQGELALVVNRGPGAYAGDDAAHLLFVNARYRSMIAGVRARKATILNEECWRTLPWKNRTKTPNDELLDVLAGVPELLEDLQTLNSWSSNRMQEEEEVDPMCLFSSEMVAEDISNDAFRSQLTTKCWATHLKLDRWLAVNSNEIYSPESQLTAPISFPSLECACLTIRYWATSVLLYGTLDAALEIPSNEASTSHTDRPHPRIFARQLARSVAYFFQDCFGVTGATAISFPLGCAMLYMGRNLKADGPYMGIAAKSLDDPMLPSVIKDFLNSMGKQFKRPAQISPGG